MKKRSGTHLRLMAQFWGNLGQEFAERMQTASEEIDDRSYSPTKAISDALFFWKAPMEHWIGACIGAGSAPVPVVFFRVTGNTGTKKKSVPAHAGPDDAVEHTALYRVGGGGVILKKQVTTELLDHGRCLRVGLKDLNKPRPAAGLYEGVAFVSNTEQILAGIQVLVV